MNEIANNAGHGALRDDGAALERRLLRSVFVLVALAVLISLPLAPWRVTTGLLLGGTLSLLNHHWLRISLRAVFGESVGGARPRLKAARYVLRYFLIALIVAAAYTLDLVSIGATLAGLCSFAAAVMVEAFMQLYFAIVYREES
jgi:ATP synthase I chain